MQILKAGALYFGLVFGAGFILGPIRIIWVVPLVGARVAELMELPIMLVITVVAARWVIRRYGIPSTLSSRLGMGCMALSLLLIAEFGLVLRLRGLSMEEYFAATDPISGVAFLVMQGIFASVPLMVARR